VPVLVLAGAGAEFPVAGEAGALSGEASAAGNLGRAGAAADTSAPWLNNRDGIGSTQKIGATSTAEAAEASTSAPGSGNSGTKYSDSKGNPISTSVKDQSQSAKYNASTIPSVFDARTAAADEAGKNVINVMDGLIAGDRASVVQILTHEDGTVSVGISGNVKLPSTANRISILQAALDKEFGAGKYKVGARTLDEASGLTRVVDEKGKVIGNMPGLCAEPKACVAAAQNQSPVTGSATLWRGAGPNPYPHTGPNAGKLSPNQMDPCPTCAKPTNQVIYNETANGGKGESGKK
ncbi:hypothetical protein, partial [Massilia eburnea]|uniref:hypothetical protein n=1 Tax=Massilia eburnea TaxID=1776165 RepID=UPI0035313170